MAAKGSRIDFMFLTPLTRPLDLLLRFPVPTLPPSIPCTGSWPSWTCLNLFSLDLTLQSPTHSLDKFKFVQYPPICPQAGGWHTTVMPSFWEHYSEQMSKDTFRTLLVNNHINKTAVCNVSCTFE